MLTIINGLVCVITRGTHYSLFHLILGVAFFQFARSLFTIFYQKNSLVIFSFSPNIPEKFVDFLFIIKVHYQTIWYVIKFQNDSSHFTITVKHEIPFSNDDSTEDAYFSRIEISLVI